MATGKQAKIWDELFRLGLTKEMVRRYLKPNKGQMYHLWETPYMVLTFPQFQKLHALVCSHYTLEELSILLIDSEYRPKSELQDNIRKCLAILLTEEGRKHFDEFKARKSKGKPKNDVRKAKAEKFNSNRQVIKRLSDPILEPEENVIEFLTEHERKTNGTFEPPIEPDKGIDSSPSVSI